MTERVSKYDNIKLKCLIVDDETIALEGAVAFVQRLDFIELVDTCTSAIEAAEILKTREIDIMFLDINMPHLSGLEFLESLDSAPLTILTTAYSEYALEGFRLNVVDYLLKPFSFKRFFQAAQKGADIFHSRILLQDRSDSKSVDTYIRQGDSFIKINWEDIYYVETMQNYLKLYLEGKMYIIHQTMTSLEEMLPKESFFRIHKSFLVNISYIKMISGNRLYVNDKELPISKHRKDDLLNSVVFKKLISK